MSALSRDLYQTFARITKQGHSARAVLYATLAFVLGTILNFGPLGIGLMWLYEGEIWKAIYVPILLYLFIGFYLAFWPVFFLVWWYNGTFLTALGGTAILLLLFAAPDWLMYRATLAAEKAHELEVKLQRLEPDTSVLHDIQHPEQATLASMATPIEILTCQNTACGAKLRVPSGKSGFVACPLCRTRLFWNHTSRTLA